MATHPRQYCTEGWKNLGLKEKVFRFFCTKTKQQKHMKTSHTWYALLLFMVTTYKSTSITLTGYKE